MTQWKKPNEHFHAHFDCFSGAAGDMMLASCIDAAGPDADSLLEHVVRCLNEGLPELKGEFSLERKRVWRGTGSIAATQILVSSKYQHKAAPVPAPSESHSHSHEHSPAGQIHDHSHSHGHSHSHSHGHEHGHAHEHGHRSHSHSSEKNGPLRNLPEIRAMIEAASDEFLSPWVKKIAVSAFVQLAKAEAHVHGAESEEAVHFHEVGAVDSIVDTVGTCIALDALSISSISVSRLPLGEGTVRTDHGLLPVPAPATLKLMIGMPTTSGPPGLTGELVTPTAAALLRVMIEHCGKTSSPGRPPRFTLQKTGIGAGSKDFPDHPNVLRLLVGDSVVDTK